MYKPTCAPGGSSRSNGASLFQACFGASKNSLLMSHRFSDPGLPTEVTSPIQLCTLYLYQRLFFPSVCPVSTHKSRASVKKDELSEIRLPFSLIEFHSISWRVCLAAQIVCLTVCICPLCLLVSLRNLFYLRIWVMSLFLNLSMSMFLWRSDTLTSSQ